MRLRTLATLLLVAVPLPSATAQQQGAGLLIGTVLAQDGNAPLSFATVTVTGQARTTVTDHRGRFRFTSMPPGSATILVRLIGYRALEQKVEIAGGDTTRLVLRLVAAPLVLGTVRTTGKREERERFETRPNVGTIALGAQELSQAPPVGEHDVMRTVQLLPGVVSKNDYSAGYSVRAGESDQNLILLDGIPIYNPYHLFGLFSTFPEGMVGAAEMLTGGFTAEYGGRLSSVLAVTSANEPRPGVHGQVAFSLLASTVALGGSLPSLRTSWNTTVRRTYADRLASAVTDRTFPYHFRDEHIHVAHLLKSGGRISVTGYDGADLLAGEFTSRNGTGGESAVSLGWGNAAAGVTWLQPLGELTTLTQRASITRFNTQLDQGSGSRVFRNAIVEARASSAVTRQVGSHRLSGGYEYARIYVRFRDLAPRLTATLQSLYQESMVAAGFVEDNWRIGDKFIARPGVRVEKQSGAEWVGVSPRLSLKYFLTPNLAVTGAATRHAQWVHSLRREDAPLRSFDLWLASDAHVPVATATHLLSGVEAWLGPTRMVRVEGYWKGYSHLVEPDPADDEARRGDEVRPIDGRSYGVDLFLRQLEGGRAGGWLAYGYSLASRTQGTERYFPSQDRRHSLNAVLTYRAFRQSTIAAHFGFGTGTPYTPIVAQIIRRAHDPVSGYWDTGGEEPNLEPVGEPRNGARYPGYHRLDLSVERTFRKGDARITPSVHLLNVYNRQNVFSYVYDYDVMPPTREALSQFPLLPSVGLKVAF